MQRSCYQYVYIKEFVSISVSLCIVLYVTSTTFSVYEYLNDPSHQHSYACIHFMCIRIWPSVPSTSCLALSLEMPFSLHLMYGCFCFVLCLTGLVVPNLCTRIFSSSSHDARSWNMATPCPAQLIWGANLSLRPRKCTNVSIRMQVSTTAAHSVGGTEKMRYSAHLHLACAHSVLFHSLHHPIQFHRDYTHFVPIWLSFTSCFHFQILPKAFFFFFTTVVVYKCQSQPRKFL